MAAVKHGANKVGKRTPLYGRWLTMRNKCSNPNNSAYRWYGAKGIKVCERWNDFAAFQEDVGEPPGPGYSLDRWPNGQGDYEPGNVRWATWEEQNNNKPDGIGSRGVRLVTLPDGRRMSIRKTECEMGFKVNTLKNRLNQGWPQEHLFDPPGTSRPEWRRRVSP
jgi:hypothetical protein